MHLLSLNTSSRIQMSRMQMTIHWKINSCSVTPPPRDGLCIVCLTNVANVLYFDCKHMATCEACHLRIKEMHVENCHRWFAENERKLNRELNRVRCPKCNVVYNTDENID